MIGNQPLERFALHDIVDQPLALIERDRERQSDQQQDRKIELQEQRLAGNRQVESCEMADIDRQRNCGGHGHD